MTNMTKKITYILVTHESYEHFPEVIDNLRHHTKMDTEIITIDNASKNTGYLAGNRIIRNTDNLMFTRAVNCGLSIIDHDTDLIILVNPDVRISPNTINNIVRDMYSQQAGIAGALQVYPDFTIQHGGGIAGSRASADSILAQEKHKHICYGKHLFDSINNYPIRCRWVTGAFMAIDRMVFDKLGPLDECYEHYKSDIEYCLRAEAKGFRVICSSAVCLHFHKQSSKKRIGLTRRLRRIKFRWQERQFVKRCESGDYK